ncbi:ABC transporter substrate-binding protein [Acidisphaera sp. S103]|uniref:ABC transporter substrate-binding protein n=1 Tax=Acidisphaera sp. S103 TaxID=1747223 RepID=UPI00131D5225|nr:ABC transporter substrate-binding protein [Acidisphaera sp. S103]
MPNITRRAAIAAASALPVVALAPRIARAETQLDVTVNGGTFLDGWHKTVIEPFERANPGVRIRVVEGLTYQSVALMRAQKGSPTVDVIMMDDVAATEAAGEGLVHPLSLDTVPNLQQIYPDFRVAGDAYTKIYYVPEVIAYNTELVKTPPTSWQDLWDAKYKGRLAVYNLDGAVGMMFFLIVNQMAGGTIENADPGFAAMRKLKPDVLTYPTQHAQVSQLFTQGDIVIAPWVSDRANTLNESGAPIAWTMPKEGSVMAEGTLAIAKGTKNLDMALKYVNFAIGAGVQADNARTFFVAPVNQQATLDEKTRRIVPNGAEALKLIRRPDWKSVNQHRAQWIDRWNREIIG